MSPAAERSREPLADGTIEFDQQTVSDFNLSSQLEWLETNGLGGWASSTVSGANTRRYHGLLVAAARPPLGRVVLLSKLDETLQIGGDRFELASNQYPGTVEPDGYRRLTRFTRGVFPSFEYRCEQMALIKTVIAIHGSNTTVICYELERAVGPVTLELTPLIAGRDYHALGRERDMPQAEFSETSGTVHVGPFAEELDLFLRVQGSGFRPAEHWYRNVEYLRELDRGFDFREDLWAPGTLSVELHEGSKTLAIASTEPGDTLGVELIDQERARRLALVNALPVQDEVTTRLALAADQFIVRRGPDLHSVIAGYHWFGDWGRDTMIALPGLCLVTGRFEEARSILRAFAGAMSEGMVPNRFPDIGVEPEYNSVDSTLWMFVAVESYLRYTGDEEFAKEMLPFLREAVNRYSGGTRFGIREDEDGLISAGETGQQLTWMDARIGDWVVTPREGKAVEINALWYNALSILRDIERRVGTRGAAEDLDGRAVRVRRQFERVFWNDEKGCLFDVVDGTYRDGAIRPNQLFAISLAHPLVSAPRAGRILDVVEERLLTPFGLRSLEPRHPDYRGQYEGDPVARDAAYHQGTAWAWLLGPYLSALCRWRGTAGKQLARGIMEAALVHLREACVGSFSEIFDGDTHFCPRGAVAQAWSVAELLRAYVEDIAPN